MTRIVPVFASLSSGQLQPFIDAYCLRRILDFSISLRSQRVIIQRHHFVHSSLCLIQINNYPPWLSLTWSTWCVRFTSQIEGLTVLFLNDCVKTKLPFVVNAQTGLSDESEKAGGRLLYCYYKEEGMLGYCVVGRK